MRNVFEREFVFLNLLKKSALKNFFKKAQSNCNPMDKQIAEYVSTTLQQMAILDTADVGFENIVIDAFKTHHENGVVFSHQNGETYGLAFLNALTQESASKITRELKKKQKLEPKISTRIGCQTPIEMLCQRGLQFIQHLEDGRHRRGLPGIRRHQKNSGTEVCQPIGKRKGVTF